MYEVELKVEITAEEKERVITNLKNSGFVEKDYVAQIDCYVEAEKSPHGGYNLKRYRNEDGKIFYTQKTWEMENGELARKEEERESSQVEFDEGLKKSSHPITIKKDRQSFDGSYKDTKIHIDMDTIKFDHSSDMRYFIETEIITAQKEEVKNIREFIREFLKKLLEKSELIEAPGMFTMAFEKK